MARERESSRKTVTALDYKNQQNYNKKPGALDFHLTTQPTVLLENMALTRTLTQSKMIKTFVRNSI